MTALHSLFMKWPMKTQQRGMECRTRCSQIGTGRGRGHEMTCNVSQKCGLSFVSPLNFTFWVSFSVNLLSLWTAIVCLLRHETACGETKPYNKRRSPFKQVCVGGVPSRRVRFLSSTTVSGFFVLKPSYYTALVLSLRIPVALRVHFLIHLHPSLSRSRYA